MAKKGQDTQTYLMVEDVKYEASKTCEICGMPTRSLAVKCLRCIEALWLTGELEFIRDCLRATPGRPLETAHDKRKKLHLVTFRADHLGWCGAKLTQVKAKREKATPGMFPPGICEQCLDAYEAMA